MAIAVEDRVKALTPTNPELALKDAENRLRVIERGHKRLETLLTHNYEWVRDRLAGKEVLYRNLQREFTRLYTQATSPYTMFPERAHLGLANFITALTWLNIDYIRDWLDSSVVSKGAKIIEMLRNGRPLGRLLSVMGVRRVIRPVSLLVHHLAVAVGHDKNKVVDIIDWESAATLSPLSRLILNHTLFNYTRGTREGARIGLLGPLGSGKTTFAFLSLYSALRYLGMNKEEALELARACCINDALVLVKVLQGVTQRKLFTPAIIADDISAIISKHWTLGDVIERRAVPAFLRAIKISREGFGAIIFPSDTKESIPKAIRESLDVEYNGEMVQGKEHRATLWLRTKTETRSRPHRGVRRETVIADITATACPPLLVPPIVYAALEEQKRAVRATWLKKAGEELVKGMRGEEGGNGKKRKRSKSLDTDILDDWGLDLNFVGGD